MVNGDVNISVNPPLTPTLWNMLGCKWAEKELATSSRLFEYVLLPEGEKVELLNKGICSVNDCMQRNPKQGAPKHATW